MFLVYVIVSILSTVVLFVVCSGFFFFFFKQKTAYEMRISDWSSDVCSSDLKQQCLPVMGIRLYMECIRLEPVTGASFCADCTKEIGRASCRERVCQYV